MFRAGPSNSRQTALPAACLPGTDSRRSTPRSFPWRQGPPQAAGSPARCGAPGRTGRPCMARVLPGRSRSSSGTAPALLQFGADLPGGVGVACREVLPGLPQVRESLLVAEDVECLLQGLVLRHRDQHDVGAAVAGDGEVVMLAGYPVGEFGDPCLRFGNGYGLHGSHFTDRSKLWPVLSADQTIYQS